MSIPRLTQLAENTPKENHLFQLVSSVGDGTGVTDLIGAAPAAYTITPGAGEKFTLKRLNMLEVDGSFNNAAGYGAGSALTNGITITVENAEGVIVNYTPKPIKTTFEWALLAGVDSAVVGGAGADPHMVRWTFGKGCGYIELDGDKGEFFKVDFGDAMSFMTSIHILVQGCK